MRFDQRTCDFNNAHFTFSIPLIFQRGNKCLSLSLRRSPVDPKTTNIQSTDVFDLFGAENTPGRFDASVKLCLGFDSCNYGTP